MSYFTVSDRNSPLAAPTIGSFGTGPSCGGLADSNFVPGEERLSATPSGPLFRLQCTIGCGPVLVSPVGCHAALRQAILDACQLALNAARKLEATLRDTRTVDEFRRFFGHDPGQLLPWPGIRDSGIRFARRFRAVAEALRRSGTLYRCDPCTGIREDPPPGAILDTYAIAIPLNEVVLCPSFWMLPPFLRAGVILHEMFHLRFDPCFGHGACETKRTSAYCYEGFALSIGGHSPEQLVFDRCAAVKK
jgi:hypothetical protein